MASRDNYNNIGVSVAIAAAVLTVTTTSAGIDLAGFESATAVINTGAIAGSGNFTPKLQESSDNATFADVAAADLIGTFPAVLAASSIYKVGYKGAKRYIRLVLTLNSGTSITAAADIIKGHPKSAPAA